MLTKNDKGGREGKTKGDKRMAEGIREGSPQKFAEMICEQPPRAVRTLAMFKPLGRGLSYWSALTPANLFLDLSLTMLLACLGLIWHQIQPFGLVRRPNINPSSPVALLRKTRTKNYDFLRFSKEEEKSKRIFDYIFTKK